MNNQFLYTPVDKHDEHGSHYHSGIESFHGQGHHQTTQAEGDSIISQLRKEFYSTGDAPLKKIVSNLTKENTLIFACRRVVVELILMMLPGLWVTLSNILECCLMKMKID